MVWQILSDFRHSFCQQDSLPPLPFIQRIKLDLTNIITTISIKPKQAWPRALFDIQLKYINIHLNLLDGVQIILKF